MKALFIFIFLFLCLDVCFAQQKEHKIIAKVDNEVITQYDLEIYSFLASILWKKGKVFSLLDEIIDSKIKYNYAKKVGLKPNEKDLDVVLKNIQQTVPQFRNGVKAFCDSYDVSGEAYLHLIKDLEGQILWNKFVESAILPNVRISDKEIELMEESGMKESDIHNYLTALKVSEMEKALMTKVKKNVFIEKF